MPSEPYTSSFDLDPLSPESGKEKSHAVEGVWTVEELVTPGKKHELPPLFRQDAAAIDPSGRRYVRIVETLRLYAGWLLAWYFLIFALGAYQYQERFPARFDLLGDLFLSPVILLFAFGSFLFLFFTSLHKLQGRGLWNGLFLTALWIILVLLYRANI